MPFGWHGVWANAALLHTLNGIPTIDQVNWTLVIELHFYALAALVRPWILRGSLWPMLAAVAGAFGLLAMQRTGLVKRPSFLELEGMSMPYMLIGTHSTIIQRHVAVITLWAVVVGLGAVFLSLFKVSLITAGDPVILASYGYALLVFSAAYFAREWVQIGGC